MDALQQRETADIETSTDAYAARFAGPVGAWMLRVQRDAVLRLLAQRNGGTVLDVGGGHGQLAAPLADAGFRVTVYGSDPVCRRRVAEAVAAGRVGFSSGDVLALPFADKAFDAVTCIRLLPHCGRWQELCYELARVARFRVVVDYPALWSVNLLSRATFGWKLKVEGNTRPFTLFTHREVRAAFAAAGFRPAGRVGQFVLPMALHRALGSAGLSRTLEAGLACAGLRYLAGSPVVAAFDRAAGAGS